MLNKEQKSKFFSFCQKITNELMNAHVDVQISDMANKLGEIVRGMRWDDPSKKDLRDILSVLTGESIPTLSPMFRSEFFVPGLVMVATGNDNQHNYPLNVPLLKTMGAGLDTFYLPNGGTGNSLTRHRNHVRPATFEEIKLITDQQIDAACRNGLVVI